MIADSASVIAVGLGDLVVSATDDLVAYSLGSCMGVCLWDLVVKVKRAAQARVRRPLLSALPRPSSRSAPTAGPGLAQRSNADPGTIGVERSFAWPPVPADYAPHT